MYYAIGLRDLLTTTRLNREFFAELDSFHINFIEMCFKQSIEDHMGLMTETEYYNFELFEEFKMDLLEEQYGLDIDYIKKAG